MRSQTKEQSFSHPMFFFKHVSGAHLMACILIKQNDVTGKNPEIKNIPANMEVKDHSLEAENPFNLFQIMDVEKKYLANSHFLWKCHQNPFSQQNLRPFFNHQSKSPVFSTVICIPSFTSTFALECPYLFYR